MPLRHEVASFGHLLEIIQDLLLKAGESAGVVYTALYLVLWLEIHSYKGSGVTVRQVNFKGISFEKCAMFSLLLRFDILSLPQPIQP